MASLIKKVCVFSRYPLGRSYRFITNTNINRDEHVETERCEATTNMQNSEDDSPITLGYNPFERDRRLCILCKFNIKPDWKNVRLLSQFQSPYTGEIYGRHITGLCKHKQKSVEIEIRKAQSINMMPMYHKKPEFTYDPKLYDPDHPFRPHKY